MLRLTPFSGYLRSAAVLTMVALLLVHAALPVHGAGIGWYCVRAKDHAQPVADPPLREVEEYGGYYIDHAHPDPEASDRVIYLTFDAGYENGNVARVLDVLRQEGVGGAFFILGELPIHHPELVRRMAEEGHMVCNHTFSHRNLCGAPKGELTAELRRLEQACRAIGVSLSPYFRPPEGCFDRALLQEAGEAGYKTVFWSFAYADWDNAKQPSPEAALERILAHLHNGEVLLLHPTSATNASILGELLRELKSRGYRFGSLDELTGGEEP